ncbi:MAG: serine acetyltransferase [Candidatus Adiutrix sp.]|jgi:serine O-acetyltransferase|nr:serine acetyltransferase [Candidatus Adiutrix sp.]
MSAKKNPVCRQLYKLDQHLETAPELGRTVKKLLRLRQKLASFEHVSQVPTPSFNAAREIITLAQQLLFPGFFSPRPVTELNVDYHTGQILYVFYDKLSREIATAVRHDCRRYNYDCSDCQELGRTIALEIAERIPALREVLGTDVAAAREGDPAAGDHFDQIIFCYPGLFAVMVQRLAHELYLRQVPFLPRILTEYAHSKTGIDIHPGAEIGPSFFIDHGTGVVIGETTKIGAGVRLYQGVTLGALSLPRDAGVRLQGQKRHPTLEDGVTVYAGATILGGQTVIGAGSVVGGNVWLTESIPPRTKVLIKNPELVVINGSAKAPAKGAPAGRPRAAARRGSSEKAG